MLEKAGILKTTTRLVMPDWRLLLALVPAMASISLAILVAVTPIAARLIPNLYARLGLCVFLLLLPFLVGKLNRKRTN